MKILKILKIAFVLAFTLQIGATTLLAIAPQAVLAADPVSLNFESQIQIPVAGSGLDKTSTVVGSFDTTTGKMNSTLLARYIKAFYDYSMAIGGILAAIVLMGGGVLWLTSAGNDSKITQAKELIIGSITGLGILLGSWVLLNTINPDLLKMQTISTQVLEKNDFTCCQYQDKAEMTTNITCKNNGGTALTSVTNVIGKVTYYSTDSAGKTCTLPGCCIARKNKSATGEIIKCANAMYDNCDFGFFMEKSCSEVPPETGPTKDGGVFNHGCGATITDKCAEAKDGSDCFDGQYSSEGACYNKICWIGKGKVGEPCGNEKYSKCALDEPQDGNTCQQDQGGRHCINGENVWCCKFKANGLRLNN